MSHNEARSWWADVEHLREGLEGRRPGASATLTPREAVQPVTDELAVARTPPRSTPRSRRTVQITGRPAESPAPRRLVEVERRRPAPRAVDRAAQRPDRLALWAVFLGFALVLVAAMSAHG
ncbi:MAG TPA: hypothetical protein VII98_03295 [Solirubrobacteraceae bacterium]